MRKYILQLIDSDIAQLEKSLQECHRQVVQARFPSRLEQHIEKMKAKILIAKGYRDKFLNERSSVE
jgi:hypothetical protein